MISDALAVAIKEIASQIAPAGDPCYTHPALRARIIEVRNIMDRLRHDLWAIEGDHRIRGAARTVLNYDLG